VGINRFWTWNWGFGNLGIMKYKRFEELPCWNQGRELCQAIFKTINQAGFKKDFSLRDQIWKATGSIMDNIAEGFDDGSTRELIRFLGYSQRSCSEVQSQLYRALDCNYITQDQFNKVYNLASECRKQIKGFRKYLRGYGSKKVNPQNV
jgi:four helix bundle protein